MSKPKKKSPWKALLVGLGMGGLGALFGASVARGALQVNGVRASLDALSAWDLLALPVLVLFVIAVHEAGHLFAGLRQRMRFLLYVVGPFGWVGGGEGVRFRWYFNLGTLGGVAATLPDPQRPLAAQMKPVVLGGPLASLLLAAAGFALVALDAGRLSAYGLIVGFLSSVIFLVTAFPFRAGGFMSDGMQWLAYRRGGREVERRARLTTLMGMSIAGTRPRELDANTLQLAQEMATGDEVLADMGVWMYSHAHALDRGDVEASKPWAAQMAAGIEEYPDGFRQSVAIELAIFEALYLGRHKEASDWLKRAKGGVVDPSRRELAVAAVAALESDAAVAQAALDRATVQLPRGMDTGFARLGEDQIGLLRQRLQAPIASLADAA